MVRTQTLVKNCIVSVDSTPFKYYWHINYQEVKVNRMPEIKDLVAKKKLDDKKNKKQKAHPHKDNLDKLNHFFELLNKGKLYAGVDRKYESKTKKFYFLILPKTGHLRIQVDIYFFISKNLQKLHQI